MKTLIEKIRKERKQFDLKLQNGADEDCIEILKSQTVSKFNYTIPNEYLIFLRDVDGLFYNGIQIYSTKTVDQTPQNITIEGFVEANEMWRDDERKKAIWFLQKAAMHCMCIISRMVIMNMLIE